MMRAASTPLWLDLVCGLGIIVGAILALILGG